MSPLLNWSHRSQRSLGLFAAPRSNVMSCREKRGVARVFFQVFGSFRRRIGADYLRAVCWMRHTQQPSVEARHKGAPPALQREALAEASERVGF